MGQKVHPYGIRLGIIRSWLSKWYISEKDYPDTVCMDIKIRNYLEKKYSSASISKIEIERLTKNIKIIIYTSRPGVLIGKSGKDVDSLRIDVSKFIGVPVQVAIEEVKKPDLDAKLVAESISSQLVKRIAFRKAMKKAVSSTIRAGADGIKICVSGRLAGAEIARSEWIRHGRIPLHTFRADIDYALAEAKTTYGIIGVKVWICKGEIFKK